MCGFGPVVSPRAPAPRGSSGTFSDTGIGIPSDKLEEIFQPFTQAETSATRRFAGSGLGLTISKRLAKALGGDIEVQSEAGKGSTFILRVAVGLPDEAQVRQPRDDSHSGAGEARAAPPPLRGRLLVVEDVPDVQRLMSAILSRMGLAADVAEDGRMACEKAMQSSAEGRPYDLVLMDIQLPRMNGHEAARWLREQGWKGPIVALTAYALSGDREKCLAAGCDDYVAKPVTADSLREVLGQYLGRKDRNREE